MNEEMSEGVSEINCHHSNAIKLHEVKESAGSAVGDKYPPELPGCNPRGDRAKK